MNRLRDALLWAGLLLMLVVVNQGVFRRERILADGRPLLLELAPVDPRALLQGDYMALRYAAEDDISKALRHARDQDIARALRRFGIFSSTCGADGCHDGYAVFAVDGDGIGHFLRVQSAPRPLAAGEIATRFRERNWRTIRIAGGAWFFPEGQADRYAPARYGELRVDGDGTALLVALRDAARKPL